MPNKYDVIIIGGGHNGLVAARYLGAAGLRVVVLERRHAFGGPLAKVEWMPGYFCSVSNSPGSLEPKIVRELELERFGLTFVKPDPTMIHALDDRLFVGWREPERGAAQLDSYSPGEAKRYRDMFKYLEDFAIKLGVSLFEPPPTLAKLTRNLKSTADEEAFSRIFFGSARALFDDFLRSNEAKAIVAPLSITANVVSPSTPGTPLNLMMRPLSLASAALDSGYDPRNMPLRGSTGLPVGGMSGISEAMVASAKSVGVVLRLECGVHSIKINGSRVEGVITQTGQEIDASIVISAMSPRTTLLNLIGTHPDWTALQEKMRTKRQQGEAFKVILALDDMPRFANATDDAEARSLASAGYRLSPTVDYLEECTSSIMLGRAPEHPVIWGFCPSMTSPGLTPTGKHIMSMNLGAPYTLKEGSWKEERDKLAQRCIKTAARWMPNLPDIVSDYRCVDPTDFEREYGLVEGNIIHGDGLPWNQFWMRPLPGLSNYRTPTSGFYLSGTGTWPGNYVSGIPGHNTARAVLSDLKARPDLLQKSSNFFQTA